MKKNNCDTEIKPFKSCCDFKPINYESILIFDKETKDVILHFSIIGKGIVDGDKLQIEKLENPISLNAKQIKFYYLTNK